MEGRPSTFTHGKIKHVLTMVHMIFERSFDPPKKDAEKCLNSFLSKLCSSGIFSCKSKESKANPL